MILFLDGRPRTITILLDTVGDEVTPMGYVGYIEDGDRGLYLNWHAALLEWTSLNAWRPCSTPPKNSVLPISPLTGLIICLEAAFNLLSAGPTAQNVFARSKVEYHNEYEWVRY